MVFKFNKLICNLNQSLRVWYQKPNLNISSLDLDANIYLRCEIAKGFIIFTVYVDDYILFNNQLHFIHLIDFILFHKFEMFIEGELHYTISSASIRNYEKGWIILHQTKNLKLLNY